MGQVGTLSLKGPLQLKPEADKQREWLLMSGILIQHEPVKMMHIQIKDDLSPPL